MVASDLHVGLRYEERTGLRALPFYAFPNELLKAFVEQPAGVQYNWPCPRLARGWLKWTRKAAELARYRLKHNGVTADAC
jgi:hypothetical protein